MCDIQDSTSPLFPDFGALRSSGLSFVEGVGLNVESVESFCLLELGSWLVNCRWVLRFEWVKWMATDLIVVWVEWHQRDLLMVLLSDLGVGVETALFWHTHRSLLGVL